MWGAGRSAPADAPAPDGPARREGQNPRVPGSQVVVMDGA
ncbi:hypothetical protein YT1_3908 [Rhodococcus ruber]|nr:hypothetical protein YT1_3908 [Rhodococcus ruber]